MPSSIPRTEAKHSYVCLEVVPDTKLTLKPWLKNGNMCPALFCHFKAVGKTSIPGFLASLVYRVLGQLETLTPKQNQLGFLRLEGL